MGISPRGRVAALAVLFTAFALWPASAQYFGRNKVQYKSFRFQVLETEHFQVHFYPEERDAARLAARMAERWYSRFSALLRDELEDKQPLILYASHPEFAQTTTIAEEIGEATGGLTEALKRRIVMPIQGAVRETDHVIGHELVHAFQYDLSGVGPSQPLTGAPSVSYLPLWAVEGLAEYLSIGPRSSLTAMWVRDGLRSNDLPSVSDLDNPFRYFPYRWGHALWAYIGGRWGDEAVWTVFRTAARRRDLSGALDSVLQVSKDTLTAMWHRAIEAQYRPLLERTTPASAVGSLLTEAKRGTYDIAPALSPDGRRLLYLSSRDPYAIDLYLADATTGEILRRLTSSALDPHYESLEFVNSSGSWAPDNERIAFVAVAKGHPSLVIMRAATGDRLATCELPQFGAISNPTWSPAGDRIAFVANQGGFLDLWTITLAGGGIRRLTNDQAAELHPSWSPDGRRIAITTDRYGPDYDLAVVDAETGSVTQVPTFPGATSINPRWAPRGGSLYFVSNPDGIPNLYRVAVSGGTPVALTRLFTGVSGISELSPAFDAALESGAIVFTAYENGGHHLYRLNAPEQVAGGPAGTPREAATLPPAERRDRELMAMLAQPGPLPDLDGTRVSAYAPKLSLDYVSPPTFGFSVGGYGTMVGGGIALGFSDMLGYHELNTQVLAQVVGGEVLNGIGAEVLYLNRRHRLNWGILAGQAPQINQAIGQGLVDLDGDGLPELVQQTLTFWTVSRHAIVLAQYPFGPSDRVEFSAGFQRIDFHAETDERVFNPFTGDLLAQESREAPACGDSLSIRRDLCRPQAMNELRGTAALVHDRTIFGPTGPVAGSRYRFEASPSFGTLNYLSILGDWRGYQRLTGPITFALRGLHFGRYLEDAEDERLSRLFVGYPSLVRGYDDGSFSVTRCPTDEPLETCSEITVFDRLFGSRLAVANAELRVSLFGPVGVLGYGFLPADLIGFFDAGVAWADDQPSTAADERAWFLGGDRKPLTSAGVGLRINLLGFALGELYWVKPFQRPLRKGYFHLTLSTGF